MVKKGYKVEWKIKKRFEENGWVVIRSGGSFGKADLVCFKNGKCIFLQVKSTRRKEKILYYYGYMKDSIAGFPFFVVVDFGYGKIKVTKPKSKITLEDGENLSTFLEKFK